MSINPFDDEDGTFLDVLNHIREAKPTAEDINILNQRYHPAFIPKPGEGYIRLSYANSAENILKALGRMGEFLASRKAA